MSPEAIPVGPDPSPPGGPGSGRPPAQPWRLSRGGASYQLRTWLFEVLKWSWGGAAWVGASGLQGGVSGGLAGAPSVRVGFCPEAGLSGL